MDAREILKSTPFFVQVLDDDELTLLADHAQEVRYGSGDVLVREDEPGRSMFVIVSGRVRVTVGGEHDGIANLGRGDIVGEMSLLSGQPRNATVTAVEPVEALEVDSGALAHVLAGSPDLIDRFVELLFRRGLELDRAHGGAAWGMLRPGKAELAQMIGNFLRATP